MQSAPIVTTNKIFETRDIEEILAKIQENYDRLSQEAKAERAENEKFKYEYQEWKLGNFSGYLKYSIEFTDGAKVEYDNYESVKNILTGRLRSVKWIHVYYSVSFAMKNSESTDTKMVSERITLSIDEDELKIETALDDANSRLIEVRETIVAKVAAAPEKYDNLIRKKEFISWKIGVADGLLLLIVVLVGMIVGAVVMESWRQAIFGIFWVVLVLTIGLGLILGILFGPARTAKFYNKLIPNKKYAGYDSNTRQSVYNDDIEKFKRTSDVLIGAKADNGELRKRLKVMEQKSWKRSLAELCIIGVLLAVLFVICWVGRG